ncbi:MAG: hypothetical protein KDD67_03220 [Ignavibacteriae bacterium]|nr:hypothetical protein [Ignavibacteriota bacterium]MCB9217158.1 hypothetical protein [Ignavibacteria bacterium]
MPTNYEIIPVPIPPVVKNEVQALENWLEQMSKEGGDLVCFMPSLRVDKALAIFRVREKGQQRSSDDWD